MSTNDKRPYEGERPGPDDVQWIRDLILEQYLESLGVEYTLEVVHISEIDVELSLQNNARLGTALYKTVSEDYALQMMDGAKFPGLAGFRRSNNLITLAGGNHRTDGAKMAGIVWFLVYVLKVTDESKRRLITTSLNRLESSIGTNREDALSMAIDAYEGLGYSYAEAAARYKVSERAIRDAVRYRWQQRRLELAGGSPEGLPKFAIVLISGITNDIVCLEAERLWRKLRLAEADCARFIQEIREERTEAAQIAVVTRWANDRTYQPAPPIVVRPDGKGPKGPRIPVAPGASNRAELFRALSRVESTLKKGGETRGKLGLSGDDDYARAVTRAREILAHLERISGTPR
jgi:hypothetical protein